MSGWTPAGKGRGHHGARHNILRGAVPFGQHVHSPDAVLGPVPQAEPPTDAGLPTPAPRGRACTSCRTGNAIVVLGKTSLCLICWTSHVQTEGASGG